MPAIRIGLRLFHVEHCLGPAGGCSDSSCAAERPFGNSQTVACVENRADKCRSLPSGAKARAVITPAGKLSTLSSRAPITRQLSQAERARRLLQPLDAPLARFDQHDLPRPVAAHRQRPGPESPPRCRDRATGRCSTWNMIEKLQAVGEMALPDRFEAGRRDQVLALILLGQQSGEPLQPRQRRGVGPLARKTRAPLPRCRSCRAAAAR